jgi:DNA-binding MarR family transcriptional regulator
VDNNVIDSIIEDIFHIYPLIYKKLLKVDFESVEGGLSYLHFLIIRMLARSGALPISEIGKRLVIPRPQMTHLIDQLIVLDMVVRLPNTKDRRIINIELTGKGKATLQKCVELARANIKSKLKRLDDVELIELSVLLSRLNEFSSKLN